LRLKGDYIMTTDAQLDVSPKDKGKPEYTFEDDGTIRVDYDESIYKVNVVDPASQTIERPEWGVAIIKGAL
jgi:hypothetical protein